MLFKPGTLTQLALMICGDEPFTFMPYRSSSRLTAFFMNLNLDYRHDGSTRRTWVEDVLKELNQRGDPFSPYPSKELEEVIKSLVDEDYFNSELYDRQQAIQRLNQILAKYNLFLEVNPFGVNLISTKDTSESGPFTYLLSPTKGKALTEVPKTSSIIETAERVKQEVKIDNSHVNKQQVNKIFISHSSEDEKFAIELLDLLERIGVDGEKIFCTSVPGHGIPPGEENYLERLKAEINSDVLVLFVLSHNFYASPMCLCEMGATWVLSKHHIPIVIPPFDFRDIKGAIPLTQGIRINEPQYLTDLYETVRSMMGLSQLKFQTWERYRDRFVENVNQLLNP